MIQQDTRVYPERRPEIQSHASRNLAPLSAAILRRRELSLSVLARALAGSSLTKSLSRRHCKKRLFRFLSNDRFDPVRAQTALMPKVAAGGRLKGLTPIMIDWTDLGNGFNGLFAAVCFRRRGLPLMSWVSRHGELHPSQNSHEETFAERLFAGLPDAIRPLILADRGFGRAEFIKFLQNLSDSRGNPIDFAVRVKGDVWVESDGFAGNLRNCPLRRRRCAMTRSARYRKDGATKVNMVLYWGVGRKEPWHLATSLSDPKLAVKMYRKRMQPEQCFRDGKQRFDLDSATATTSARLQRLLTAVVLACCLLILAGMRTSAKFRRQVCSRGRLGVLNLGLEYYLATPNPPLKRFGLAQPQSGYA